MPLSVDRRRFLAGLGALSVAGLGAHALSVPASPGVPDVPWFRISLAEWSLHRTLRAGELDNLDFPKTAKESFGIEAVEYVNAFFKDEAENAKYLETLNGRARDHGVKNLLIMVDGEGALGDPAPKKRAQAVKNHHRWVTAAKALGCHAIRVNAQSKGSYEEQRDRAAEGLRALCEFADPHGIDVIVENHGGLSSNGAWLAATIEKADHPRCGTLPDFGNFHLGDGKHYDRYRGVKELMPFAKAVSAKSHAFDAEGNETGTDYEKMLGIVKAAGYRGWIGIEYEGSQVPEVEGIKKTKALLERVRAKLV